MEFNKSSLLGLKAELLRKQQEVANAKAANQLYVKPQKKVKIKTISDKVNEGVEKRERLDAEETEVSVDILEKSQKRLEAKSKLYDQLSQNTNKDTSAFLVNFDAKEKQNTDIVNEVDLEDSDSDSDWVEFVDSLGRTRRCLKEDLAEMKRRDTDLKPSAGTADATTYASSFTAAQDTTERTSAVEKQLTEEEAEMLSDDMKRELLRQKWEKKEQELLGARDVHYQDLLFDEARQHGVGYYAFSTDEAERHRQLEELKKLKKQTKEEQVEHLAAQANKKKQMKERLRAARRRKRERLGLPPEEEVSEEETDEEPPVPTPEPEERPTKTHRKPTQVREWDLGKEDPSRVLSQEEWVTKKREERPNEFAPPTSFQPEPAKRKKIANEQGWDRPTKPIRRPPWSQSKLIDNSEMPQEYLDDIASLPSFDFSVPPPPIYQQEMNPIAVPPHEKSPPPTPERHRAEIPPPPGLDPVRLPSTSVPSDIEKSIEQGLLFLRQQAEKREQQKGRGGFEIL